MSNTRYDIPAKAKRMAKAKRSSPAFREFYRQYFVMELGVIRGEVDLSFINELQPEEVEVARDLIRRNLHRGYTHIIEGAAALGDREAVPMLSRMLAIEPSLSRRLTIAGTLWKIDKDPCFPVCLRDMIRSDDHYLKEAHVHQIPWLGDDQAIHFLIDLLSDGGDFVRYLALSILNEIESRQVLICSDQPRRAADDYVARRGERSFMESMVKNLTEWYNKHRF